MSLASFLLHSLPFFFYPLIRPVWNARMHASGGLAVGFRGRRGGAVDGADQQPEHLPAGMQDDERFAQQHHHQEHLPHHGGCPQSADGESRCPRAVHCSDGNHHHYRVVVVVFVIIIVVVLFYINIYHYNQWHCLQLSMY